MTPKARLLLGAACVMQSVWLACSGDIAGNQGTDDPQTAVGDPNAGGAPGGGGSAAPGGGNAGLGGSGSGPVDCGSASPSVGAAPMGRLTAHQYQLTLQDLFQLSSAPAIAELPPDESLEGFRTSTEVQTISAQHLRAYLAIAERLATELLGDPARTNRVIGCATAEASCLPAFVERFGRRAFRRALTPEEATAITDSATQNALDPQDRYVLAIEMLLAAPDFLYKPEIGEGAAEVITLTPLELATRLSYALWGRAPSDELLDRAVAGELDTQAGLLAVAQSMIDDERTQVFYDQFFRQWLGYENLLVPRDPPAGWQDALLDDMRSETSAVLARYAWNGGSLLDALTTSETSVTPALASFYGLPAPGPGGTVQIPEDHVRAHTGLLTHASLISAKSDGDLIARRGNWLRRTFMCQTLEIPAAVAAMLGDLLVGLTSVQIVQKRNTEDACRGCHAQIDPIGIGFLAFDAAGHYSGPVVASELAAYGVAPALPGAADPDFDNLGELAAKLREMPEVGACLSERAFLYVAGHEPRAEDACTAASMTERFSGSGNDFKALLLAMVEDPSFRLRRAPEVTAPAASP